MKNHLAEIKLISENYAGIVKQVFFFGEQKYDKCVMQPPFLGLLGSDAFM